MEGWLGEGHRGLTCEAVQRLGTVAGVTGLEEQLADEVCVDRDGASLPGSIHGAGWEPARSARDCPSSGIIEVM